MSAADDIKARWSLDAMCAHCGITLPERGRFHSPFRPDEHPSCERYGETIKDRSTGETFDVIAIYAKAKGVSDADAIRALRPAAPSHYTPPRPKPEPQQLVVPSLHYTPDEAQQLAKLRGLSSLGVELAGFHLGTLGFAKVGGFPCWILTDGSNRIAEARRMDGEKFPAIGKLSERKSHTLRGSCKSWPLGINPPKVKDIPSDFPCVMVEGGPDYLAACDVLAHAPKEFLPVAMLGSGQLIHAEALPFFKGRSVVILAHPDEAGRMAATKWTQQLRKVGAIPDPRQLEGGDLNDLVKLHGARAVANMILP